MTDADAAIDAIRAAKSYIDRLYAENSKLTVTQQFDYLKFASMHLANARRLDATAVLAVPTKDGTAIVTQDHFCAQVLYYQGVLEAAQDTDLPGCEKALETLKQASVYAPQKPYIHREIASVLLKLHRRDEALTAARFALALDPDNADSRLLVDKISTTPTLGVKEVPPGTTEKKLGCALMLAAVIGFCTIPSLIARAIPGNAHNWPVIWTVIGLGVVFYVGFKLREWGESSAYIHNVLRKERYK